MAEDYAKHLSNARGAQARPFAEMEAEERDNIEDEAAVRAWAVTLNPSL